MNTSLIYRVNQSLGMVLTIVMLMACTADAEQTAPERIVAVHPGTELLHVINYLSGIAPPMVDEYSYRTAVDEWFGVYAEHPAVMHAKDLPYNDFVELGWAFSDETMALTMPEGFGWQSKMKSPEFLQTYLVLAEDFAKQSDLLGFFAAQQSNYEIWINQFEDRLKELDPELVLWDFFGTDPGNTVLYYSISPLGVTLRANLIMDEVSPDHSRYGVMLIPFDPQFLQANNHSTPSFEYTNVALRHAVWHEATHVIYEALVADHYSELSAITYRDCFSRNLEVFDDSAANTYFFIHEVVADAVSIFLKAEYLGDELAEEHLRLNEAMGGLLYRPLVEHFQQDYFDSRHQVNFRDHLPVFIDFIDQVAPTDHCDS